MMPRESGLALCGRHDERISIAKSVAEERETANAMLILGSAGVGKTALLDAAIRDAQAAGADVIRGSCLEIDGAWPFHPLIEAVQDLDETGVTVAAFRDLLLGGATTPDALAEVHRRVVDVAVGRRLVIALDDLQWADRSTERLLLTLLSRLTTVGLTVLGTFRIGGDGDVQPSLLSKLRNSPSTVLLPIKPLSRADGISLAELASGQQINRTEAHTIWRRSDGVPLHIVMLASRRMDRPDVPESVAAMFIERLASLSTPAQRLVRLLSTASRPIPVDEIGHLFSPSPDPLAETVREAVAAGLLRLRSGAVAVVHGLGAEAIRSTLIPSESARLHGLLADHLSWTEGGHNVLAELAYHCVGSSRYEQAFDAYRRAGRLASERGAYFDAWDCWRAALDLRSEHSPEAWADHSYLLEAAEAAFRSGDETALAILQEYESEQQPTSSAATDDSVRIELLRARYLLGLGQLQEAFTAYERVARLADSGSEEAITASIAVAALLNRMGRYKLGLARALAVRRTMLDDEELSAEVVRVDLVVAEAEAYLRNRDGAESALEHAEQLARTSDDEDLVLEVMLEIIDLLLNPFNELGRGTALAITVAEDAAAGGRDRAASAAYAAATVGLFRRGQWRDGQRVAALALAHDPTGPATVQVLLARARVLMGLGELAASELDLDSAERLIQSDHAVSEVVSLATLRAGLALWRRDPHEARRIVRNAIEQYASSGADDLWRKAPLIWHGLRAEADIRVNSGAPDKDALGLLNEARLEVKAAIEDENRSQEILRAYEAMCDGELSRCRLDVDGDVWLKAEELWENCEHPYPATYCRFRRAESALHSNARSANARELLALSYQAACGLEAEMLRQDIAIVGSAAGLNLEAADGDVVSVESTSQVLDALTPREREVLSEIATGRSNREIGSALYISERTVGVHVSRILRKLGVRSRVEAALKFLSDR